MGGTPIAGSVSAIDHDRYFKELLTTFILEFLLLFFPKLATEIDPDSIELLSQEIFVNLFDGEEYRADIVVKARFKGMPAFFLIHIEHQSTAPASFSVRLFRYYAALFTKYGVPVYPIVVYSHDSPRKAQPNVYGVDFPDGKVLRFHYRVVQLNRLPWRKFLKSHNPVACALMAKIKFEPHERPRVKIECLRLLVTLKLDPARMRLISSFVDAYLNLNEAEERVFEQTLKRANFPVEQKEELVEILTSWERRGIEKGRVEGVVEGRVEGRIEGRMEVIDAMRAVLCDVLTSRFGPLSEMTAARVRQIDSPEELRRTTHLALTASSLRDIGL